MPLTKDVLTPQEVAEYLGLCPATIYRYISQGKLAASKLGRRYRIPKDNVGRFLLATSRAGAAQVRDLSRTRIAEWLEEDRIDGETRVIGDRLVDALESP